MSFSSRRDHDPDDAFREMRERMERDRDAFFTDSPQSSSFFGRESPFFRAQRGAPSFDDFRSQSPSFRRAGPGFPESGNSGSAREAWPDMEPRTQYSSSPKSSVSSQHPGGDSSVPIRVVHERQGSNNNNNSKHKYGGHHHQTADVPTSSTSEGSPRIARAHSEPPKTFNQRLLKSKIGGVPETVGEENLANLATSASESSVPTSNTNEPPPGPPQAPPRRPSPRTKQQQHHQDQQQQQPSVRHIPIFVEGRDKPVLSTTTTSKPASTTSQQQQEPASPFTRPSEFYPPNAEVVRGAKVPQQQQLQEQQPQRRATAPPTHLKVKEKCLNAAGEPTSPLSPIPSDQPIPMGYSEPPKEEQKQQQGEVNGGEPTSPLPLPPGPIPLPCSMSNMNKTDSVDGSDNKSSQPPPAPPSSEPDQKPDPCLSKLAKVQADVADLVKRIENFQGGKKDKEYIFLDEMLTRNLLILDGIETEGRDDVRQKRRESIKSINRCLSILESRATSSQAVKNNEILSDLANASLDSKK